MTTNTAATLPRNGRTLEVGPADLPHAGPGELVVRNRAVAINPVDWIVQSIGSVAYRWLSHPAVLGQDVAGEVVEIGPGVTRFHVGDRVIGLAIGTEKDRDRPAEGGFQLFTVLSEALAAPIPDGMEDTRAVVLPLTVSTAATGLFERKNLGLRMPGTGQGGTVLVWGAGTAVGANAVQLARAAGYEVVATASSATADLVLGLGARQVVDRRAPDAVAQLVAALRGTTFAGALATGTGSARPSIDVVSQLDGVKVVASASTSASFEHLAPGPRVLLRAIPTFARMGVGETAVRVRARRSGVRIAAIWGSDLRHSDVGPAIWRDLLPAALADGRIRPFPEPLVVGDGLEALQPAMDLQRRGMSAQKVVVTL